MSGWADRAARQWSRAYTCGLVAEVRERRREELRSDLYEHRACLGATRAQQLEVASRLVRGLPSDLAWRARQARVRYVSMSSRAARLLTSALVVLVGVFNVWAGVGMLSAEGAGAARMAVLFTGAAMAAAGLVLRPTAPKRSTLLLIAAPAAPAVAFHWMAPVFFPQLLLMIVLAVATQPRQPVSQAET